MVLADRSGIIWTVSTTGSDQWS